MAARRLLIASLGIAASSIACGENPHTVGNAMLCPDESCGGVYDSGPYDSTFHLDAADAADASIDASDVDASFDAESVDADADADADVDAAIDAD